MECFETFAAAMADFYAIRPPLSLNPNGNKTFIHGLVVFNLRYWLT